ncbi:MAG: methylamine dehydrogenase accessory protein MauD [Deltaproteobacteria bacterium]|jgi:methylamine dehydrogenase accessory protein MauD|nr:methylamine dehydrogenase accessory protein MauD [Deltaproteobacteria bacterium]MBW1873825.1 methylamine dehydrogenase accessory protein MauD [Deltaproteobacteria bacterium]MBW2211840.1 methylamine dehydrogenase accessory protein MauD [Deltaproteobacteria bacterium]MBW2379644.1 methylamine dehydrogenase accessory protein MauD [Deltaproteobacteria bacterium]RLB44821.1 MAG: methylamine dehydrogenase accessory protein MauD [Deltaproteobacteria bacterium]
MIDALLISNGVLWLLVIGLALTVLALTRQIGLLHERISPVGALSPQAKIKVGDPAPELALIDLHDRPLQIGGTSKDESRTLLFFLSPTCPVCETLLPTVERVARTEVPRVRVVLASDGLPDEHRVFVDEKRISHLPYVLSAPLGMAYGVAKLPYAVLIDEGGIVAAQGLVNTREHLESLFEAQRRGIASIQDYLEEKAK